MTESKIDSEKQKAKSNPEKKNPSTYVSKSINTNFKFQRQTSLRQSNLTKSERPLMVNQEPCSRRRFLAAWGQLVN